MATIKTILTLQDKMSKPLFKIGKGFEKLDEDSQRAAKRAIRNMNKFSRSVSKGVDESIKKVAKLSAAVATIAIGTGLKMGFTEAFNIEGYLVQLETATKSTEKASKLMQEAIAFANRTPFETGAVVEATAKMEMYGLSSRRWLKDIADMSGATNKSIMQATEAMADATVGEFERLKEFGIKKDMIMLESAKKFGKGVVFNTKGQVLDQAKLMDVLQSMMRKKYEGGADKLSRTTRGMWSTVTGVTKNAMAQIVGIQEDGSIRQGSMLEFVRDKIQKVSSTLEKWQKDGTIEKISKQFTESFQKMVKWVEEFYGFIKDNKETIESIAVFVASLYTVNKAILIIKSTVAALELVMWALNGAMAANPIGAIVVAVAAVITAGYQLYKYWDDFVWQFKEWWRELSVWFTNTFDSIINKIKEAYDELLKFLGLRSGTEFKTQAEINKIYSIEDQRKAGLTSDSRSGMPSNIPQFADGGIANRPSIFGEAGAEIAIPLTKPKKDKRVMGLLNMANKMLGSGGGSVTINNNNNQKVTSMGGTMNQTNDQRVIINIDKIISGNSKEEIAKSIYDIFNLNMKKARAN